MDKTISIFMDTRRIVRDDEPGLRISSNAKEVKRRRGKRGGKPKLRRAKRKFVKKCERLAKNNLRIITWNCSSVKQRGPVLERLVHDADIVLLQETRCKAEGYKLRIPGFRIISNHKNRGQAIIARNEIKASEIKLDKYETDGLQLMGVQVDTGTTKVSLINVYACNDSLVTTAQWNVLERITREIGGKFMFCGDFNARGRAWGNTITKPQGEALEDYLISSQLICINDNTCTRLAKQEGHTDSVIDLALVSPELVSLLKWKVLTCHGSDHLPCSILLKRKQCGGRRRKADAFVYAKSEDVVGRLRSNVRRPKRSVVYQQPAWWNEEIEGLWKVKRLATKKWQKIRKSNTQSDRVQQAYREKTDAVQRFKDAAKESKSHRWEKFCQDITRDKALIKFWQLHRSMNGQPSSRQIGVVNADDGTPLMTDEAKGKAFLTRYIQQTDQKNLDERKATVGALTTHYDHEDSGLPFEVDVERLQMCIKSSHNSAPGPDKVDYDALKSLSDQDLQELATLYQDSLTTGTIREDWLHSYLAVIPKPGRDATKLSSYRIITMQNTIGKIMEKMIARSLTADLEDRSQLPPSLGSYRPGRDTWANAAIFSFDVYEAFQRKEETLSVALDLEDAYNRVSFNTLIDILVSYEVNPFTIKWIAAALMERTVALRLGDWVSTTIKITPGLPQGSALSPVLYNVYTSKLADMQIPRGRILTFADDVLVYTHGSGRQGLANKMNHKLEEISAWCKETGSVVNPAKATTMWCSLDNHIVNKDMPQIALGNDAIERVNKFKYLGISFDRTLSFKEHVEYIVQRCSKGLTAMKVMAGAQMEQRLLLMLYRALVLSVLDYGLGIITIRNTHLQKLERIQNEAMRIILGCTRMTSAAAMRYVLDLPSIEERHLIAQVKAMFRVARDNQHLLHCELGTEKGSRLKRGTSWMAQAETTVNRICNGQNIKRGKDWTVMEEDLKEMNKVVISMGRECRERCPLAVNAEVCELIEELVRADDCIIFTDGSVKRGARSGWGFSARCEGRIVKEQSEAYTMTTSSLRMEEEAVTAALKWISGTKHTATLIATDSQCLLKKLMAGNIKPEWKESINASKLKKLVWIYTPGHAGVRGNERADELAGTGNTSSDFQWCEADVMCEIRLRNESVVHDSETIGRLQELGIQKGDGCRSTLKGTSRHRSNQKMMGTISTVTLSWLLERAAECLWTCPTCHDAYPTNK